MTHDDQRWAVLGWVEAALWHDDRKNCSSWEEVLDELAGFEGAPEWLREGVLDAIAARGDLGDASSKPRRAGQRKRT